MNKFKINIHGMFLLLLSKVFSSQSAGVKTSSIEVIGDRYQRQLPSQKQYSMTNLLSI